MFLKKYKDLSPFGKMAVSSFRGAVLGMFAGLLLGTLIYFLQFLLQWIDLSLNPVYAGLSETMYMYRPMMWPSVTIPGGLGTAFGTLIGAILGGISGIRSDSKK